MRTRLVMVLLFVSLTGCDGAVFKMTVRPAGNTSAIQQNLISIVRETAVSHGMQPIPPTEWSSSKYPAPLLIYIAHEPPEWGGAFVGVKIEHPKPEFFLISVFTFPSAGYPIGKNLRAELKDRVVKTYGGRAVHGF